MRWSRARPWVALASAVAALVAVVAVAQLQRDDDPDTPPSTSTGTTTQATTSTTTTTVTSSQPEPTPSLTSTTTEPSGAPALVVRRGSPDRAVVALTFDAGSDTGYAAEILDALAANEVIATFGMTGRWAEANPDLVRRMVAEGHQLVNHTYDHPSFTGWSTGTAPLTRAERIEQLDRADAAIRAAAGVTAAPWFRPPYGDEDESVRVDVGSAGYAYELLWTVDSLGWKGDPPDDVARRCLDGAVPGAIYLLHVGAASSDHLALQPIIDGLRARGYGFTTASGLVLA